MDAESVELTILNEIRSVRPADYDKIMKVLNLTESELYEVLDHLEDLQYITQDSGSPPKYEVTEIGQKYLHQNTEKLEAFLASI